MLSMRGRDLNTTGGVWEYQPASHKSEHRGKSRQVFLGPKAQAIVKEFLTTDLQAFLFSPQEAVRVCGPVGSVYRRDAYRRAITRACERAFGLPHELRYPEYKIDKLPEEERAAEVKRRRKAAAEWPREHCWFPHQLRHSAATIIRREAGIETARCVLGHSDLSTTELYAEADLARAARDMLKRDTPGFTSLDLNQLIRDVERIVHGVSPERSCGSAITRDSSSRVGDASRSHHAPIAAATRSPSNSTCGPDLLLVVSYWMLGCPGRAGWICKRHSPRPATRFP